MRFNLPVVVWICTDRFSGGQRQRVAIWRAIGRKPKPFLFDNLDAELRTRMRAEIAKLHRDLGVTMVYVTYDQIEAMTLADRIVVLRAVVIEQVGSPSILPVRTTRVIENAWRIGGRQ